MVVHVCSFEKIIPIKISPILINVECDLLDIYGVWESVCSSMNRR